MGGWSWLWQQQEMEGRLVEAVLGVVEVVGEVEGEGLLVTVEGEVLPVELQPLHR